MERRKMVPLGSYAPGAGMPEVSRTGPATFEIRRTWATGRRQRALGRNAVLVFGTSDDAKSHIDRGGRVAWEDVLD